MKLQALFNKNKEISSSHEMIVLCGPLNVTELVSNVRMETQRAGVVTCTKTFVGWSPLCLCIHPHSFSKWWDQREEAATSVKERRGYFLHCTEYVLVVPHSKNNNFHASMDSKHEKTPLLIKNSSPFFLCGREKISGSKSNRVGSDGVI